MVCQDLMGGKTASTEATQIMANIGGAITLAQAITFVMAADHYLCPNIPLNES
jgi:hypothetical protein